MPWAMSAAGSPAGRPIRERVRAAFCGAGRADRRLHLPRHAGNASSRSGRGPRLATVVRPWMAAGLTEALDHSMRRAVLPQHDATHLPRKARLRPPSRSDRRRDPRRPLRRWRPASLGPRLAAEQGANPLTVAKAYQGFQDEGLIVVKRGVGMFVAPGARGPAAQQSSATTFIASEWPAIRERMTRLGIDADELLKAERA